MSKVYAYNPVPKELNEEEARYIKTPEHAEYMLLPRMALSENPRSQPQQKSWPDVQKRMKMQYQRYEALGINYAKATFDVRQMVLLEQALLRAIVTLTTEVSGAEIRYTLDGSEPTAASSLFTKPFVIRKTTTIKAATFKGKQAKRSFRRSAPISVSRILFL